MKNWKELTLEELNALTDEQIYSYKDLICKEAGIQFQVKPNNCVLESKIKEVTKEFQNAVDNAYLTMAHRDLLAEKYYQDFLPICGNKSNIATEFLKKVYIVDDEDMRYILSHPIK